MKDRPTLLLEFNKIHATGIKEIDEALELYLNRTR